MATRTKASNGPATEPVTDIGTLITRTPGVRVGDPCLVGTRITVRNIVIWHQMGWFPEEIVARYPHLTLAKVYAGLTYYYSNKEQLDVQFAADEEEEERLEREYLEKHGTLRDMHR